MNTEPKVSSSAPLISFFAKTMKQIPPKLLHRAPSLGLRAEFEDHPKNRTQLEPSIFLKSHVLQPVRDSYCFCWVLSCECCCSDFVQLWVKPEHDTHSCPAAKDFWSMLKCHCLWWRVFGWLWCSLWSSCCWVHKVGGHGTSFRPLLTLLTSVLHFNNSAFIMLPLGAYYINMFCRTNRQPQVPGTMFSL